VEQGEKKSRNSRLLSIPPWLEYIILSIFIRNRFWKYRAHLIPYKPSGCYTQMRRRVYSKNKLSTPPLKKAGKIIQNQKIYLKRATDVTNRLFLQDLALQRLGNIDTSRPLGGENARENADHHHKTNHAHECDWIGRVYIRKDRVQFKAEQKRNDDAYRKPPPDQPSAAA